MVSFVINYSGGSTPIHWLTIPFAALSVGQKAVSGSLELQVLPSYSPFWCCSWSKKTRNQRTTFIESKRIPKTSRVTTCNKAEYSRQGFLRIYPETAHTTASSTTLAFHPHFFLFSSHRCIPSLFTLYSSSFVFLYPGYYGCRLRPIQRVRLVPIAFYKPGSSRDVDPP